jgi:DNA-binding protein HU-beta
MNKIEIITQMSTVANISKIQAGKALNAMIDSIINVTKEGHKVTLIGFGTFSVSDRAEREGRNPKTGTKIKIPATKVPKFTASKKFKYAVNIQKVKTESEGDISYSLPI